MKFGFARVGISEVRICEVRVGISLILGIMLNEKATVYKRKLLSIDGQCACTSVAD